MPKSQFDSRVLRQIAEELFEQFSANDDLWQSEREDFVISLVRQWITYDGNAALFLRERQIFLVLGRTPLGNPRIIQEPGPKGWMKILTKDWKVSPDDFSDIIDQLNRGQSAEVVNGDGITLRLWVNPQDRSQGVDPQAKEEALTKPERDYLKIATGELERHFGETIGLEEIDDLACSVASQWQRYDGHACVFLDGHNQIHFKFTEHDDGNCGVVKSLLPIDLDALLSFHGFSPNSYPEIIAKINLGRQIEFQNKQGIRSRLWHDPKARRICVKLLDPVKPKSMTVSQPVLCPQCTAVLRPWQNGESQQNCPLCGHRISLL